MTARPPSSIDEVRAWLHAMDPGDRVHLVRLLADTKTIGELAAIGDATIAELFADRTAMQVANELGLSVKQVRRAVEQHRARQRAQPATPDAAPPAAH